MPTYDYVCDACEHAFEEFQSITAAALKKCPACKKNKLRRLIGTGAGVIFKGSGFYETDYRSDSYNKDKKADAEPKADSKDKKADTKASKTKDTPAKPDKKTDNPDSKPAKQEKNK